MARSPADGPGSIPISRHCSPRSTTSCAGPRPLGLPAASRTPHAPVTAGPPVADRAAPRAPARGPRGGEDAVRPQPGSTRYSTTSESEVMPVRHIDKQHRPYETFSCTTVLAAHGPTAVSRTAPPAPAPHRNMLGPARAQPPRVAPGRAGPGSAGPRENAHHREVLFEFLPSTGEPGQLWLLRAHPALSLHRPTIGTRGEEQR